MGTVKTTVELADGLLSRAKRLARERGVPLRALLEEGLRHVLEQGTHKGRRFVLPDRSVGRVTDPNPLESLSWQDLRDEIYGGR
jgi:hypothetical protein